MYRIRNLLITSINRLSNETLQELRENPNTNRYPLSVYEYPFGLFIDTSPFLNTDIDSLKERFPKDFPNDIFTIIEDAVDENCTMIQLDEDEDV